MKKHWLCKKCGSVLALHLEDGMLINQGINKQEIKVRYATAIGAVCQKCGHENILFDDRLVGSVMERVLKPGTSGYYFFRN